MNTFIDISNEKGAVEVVLDTVGMDVDIFGAFHTKGNEHRDISVKIIHKAKHTRARITLKGVCEDSSILNIVGTIVVEKTAQGTQSFLKENILILSEKSSAHATPNLEIHTDDVKCSHAATISQIPKEHLFYLMSRGISQQNAQQLIIDGFLKPLMP